MKKVLILLSMAIALVSCKSKTDGEYCALIDLPPGNALVFKMHADTVESVEVVTNGTHTFMTYESFVKLFNTGRTKFPESASNLRTRYSNDTMFVDMYSYDGRQLKLETPIIFAKIN